MHFELLTVYRIDLSCPSYSVPFHILQWDMLISLHVYVRGIVYLSVSGYRVIPLPLLCLIAMVLSDKAH